MNRSFLSFLIVFSFVLAVAHYLILATLGFIFGSGGGLDWPTAIWSIAFPVLFIAGNFIASKYFDWFTRLFNTLVSLWLGFFVYGFFASVIFWLIFNFLGNTDPKLLGYVLFGLAALAGVAGIINAQFLRITRVTVKLHNLPQSWVGKNILFLSDTHFGHVRNINFAHKIAHTLAGLSFEALLIGGDMFDGAKVPADELAKIMSEVKAPLGKFFVTGNHEEFTANRDNVHALERHGIKVLNNEVVNLDGLQIAGVDYLMTAPRDSYSAIVKQLKFDKSKPSILIKHVPNNLDLAQAEGFSLHLSGHTHRGQVFPGRLFTRRIFKGYDYGLKALGSMQVLTSSGAGTWGPPMRVGTIPEVVLITLQ